MEKYRNFENNDQRIKMLLCMKSAGDVLLQRLSEDPAFAKEFFDIMRGMESKYEVNTDISFIVPSISSEPNTQLEKGRKVLSAYNMQNRLGALRTLEMLRSQKNGVSIFKEETDKRRACILFSADKDVKWHAENSYWEDEERKPITIVDPTSPIVHVHHDYLRCVDICNETNREPILFGMEIATQAKDFTWVCGD